MYKLWHFLFGWDYIHWANAADQGIARVFTIGGGGAYYWRYKSTNVLDKADGSNSRVTWLTCPRSKYFPEEGEK